MKKILWVCNTPLTEIQDAVGLKCYGEGWLTGISNQLRTREDIELHYAFPQNIYKRVLNIRKNGIIFWGFYNGYKTAYTVKKESIQIWNYIIQKVNPDIIHIFGTEYSHSLECLNSIKNKEKVVISLQGIISELAKVYLHGIPTIDRFIGKFKGNQYQCIFTEKIDFYKRGMNERTVLLNAGHVIGRTYWDRKCVKRINPKCKYYHCNETLRDTFYEGIWDINKIQRYSIFVSQGNYSIKGLHMLIPALSAIKKKYPDVMVYVAGNKNFIKEDTSYGHLIKKLLKKHHVEENFIFLGFLTGEKIKQRLLKSHIIIMPSLLENSPNSIGEAMLLGVPVVASNVGGIPNILHNNTDGYLYSVNDKNDLQNKVCKIFANDSIALNFSKNARKTAQILFDKSRNLEQLLYIYNEIGGCN